ncbi:unnamed protein product [Timema podura]|uniref:Band 7 domain-containing protein n=1 Tax=Timema podura TaxID=61482 RepID=A0ABN7NNZ2_TIMPD|nr:unnamed protein product [Timema podura]
MKIIVIFRLLNNTIVSEAIIPEQVQKQIITVINNDYQSNTQQYIEDHIFKNAEFVYVDIDVTNYFRYYLDEVTVIDIKNYASDYLKDRQSLLLEKNIQVMSLDDIHTKIDTVVQTFNEEQAVTIKEANAAISFSSVSADLAYVKNNFGNRPEAITSLEARDLPLMKAVKIMRGIEENMNKASGSFGTAIVDKFNRVFQRNPGLKVMASIADTLEAQTTSLPKTCGHRQLHMCDQYSFHAVGLVQLCTAIWAPLTERWQYWASRQLSSIVLAFQCPVGRAIVAVPRSKRPIFRIRNAAPQMIQHKISKKESGPITPGGPEVQDRVS